MNFDTRTIIDLIELNLDIANDIRKTIKEEQKFSEKIHQYDYDIFVDSISSLLKDIIKCFLKKNLKDIDLSILKNMITIDNIDYKIFVNEIQKNNT